MRRRALIGLAVVALALTAGCFGGGVDEEALAEDRSYDWNTSADVTVDVGSDEYKAVFEVRNGDTLEVYRLDQIGGEQPVPIRGVRFRYPNGTVVGPERIGVEQDGDRTVLSPPGNSGQLAYSAPTLPKRFAIPVLVEGSYEVILPAETRVTGFLLGSVSPGSYERTIQDDRVHLRWTDTPSNQIQLEYYLVRDRYIFYGLVALLAVLAVAGVIYYRLQIRSLE
jgi:hypothetical protein